MQMSGIMWATGKASGAVTAPSMKIKNPLPIQIPATVGPNIFSISVALKLNTKQKNKKNADFTDRDCNY